MCPTRACRRSARSGAIICHCVVVDRRPLATVVAARHGRRPGSWTPIALDACAPPSGEHRTSLGRECAVSTVFERVFGALRRTVTAGGSLSDTRRGASASGLRASWISGTAVAVAAADAGGIEMAAAGAAVGTTVGAAEISEGAMAAAGAAVGASGAEAGEGAMAAAGSAPSGADTCAAAVGWSVGDRTFGCAVTSIRGGASLGAAAGAGGGASVGAATGCAFSAAGDAAGRSRKLRAEPPRIAPTRAQDPSPMRVVVRPRAGWGKLMAARAIRRGGL
jgi:hypothetical protein